MESKDSTRVASKNIIESFLLNTENASKFAKTKTAYKKDTV